MIKRKQKKEQFSNCKVDDRAYVCNSKLVKERALALF